MLRARRLDDGEFEPYFTVSLRWATPDGRFNGVIVVAIASSYFASFYDSLLGSGRYAAALLRSDGVILARYPAPDLTAGPPLPDPLLVKAIGEEPATGIVESGTPFDGAGRIVAIKRVADYPVYVTIERRKASILGDWLQTVAGYASIGAPAAIALIALSLLALRRARREESALARAGKAFAGQAALEVRLHRAQRLEALGLLTTGVATDFTKVASEIRHNIECAAAAISDPAAPQQPLLAAAQDGCTRAAGLAQRLLSLTQSEPLRPQPAGTNEPRPASGGTAQFRLPRSKRDERVWSVRHRSKQLLA
jgi:two-component system NtrC family sensor kinase